MAEDDEGAKKPEVIDDTDVLNDWLVTRVVSTFRCPREKAVGMCNNEASRAAIETFYQKEDVQRLVVTANPDPTASLAPPEDSNSKKTLCFLKLNETELNPENVDQEVIYGDFGNVPLEHLSVLAETVFLPMLTNPKNQVGWPEVITKEVVENLHKFIANVSVTIGQMDGKTRLPMPPEADATPVTSASPAEGEQKSDKDQIHVLESAVVTWTRQIKGVLKSDPESVLKAEGEPPGPDEEIKFWKNKADNLDEIHAQLSEPRIRKVVKVLELSKSSYFPAFERLCEDVARARTEARDNHLFLTPLEAQFEKLKGLGTSEYVEMSQVFRPIMHLILLVWKHSRHYNTPGRVVVLMREICNEVISVSRAHVDPENLLQDEPADAVAKLKLALQMCGSFKAHYFEYKSRTAKETPRNPWKFQNSALFSRLDAFLERCHDLLDLTQTVLQFNKLERVEVGGTRGKTLSANVAQVFADFQAAAEKFKNVEYDVLDIDHKQFDDDFFEFRTVVKELERRLGSVIVQGFEDCATVAMAFKLFEAFEGLLDREIIMTDLEKKQVELVRQFGADLKEVQRIFDQSRDDPVIAKNAPPFAGSVAWVRGLVQRIKQPMEKLEGLSKLVMETDESIEIQKLYRATLAQLERYESERVKQWIAETESTSDEKLKLNLLRPDERGEIPGLLRVNFDPMLVKLLREVKYFLLLEIPVPEAAMKTYQRGETLRQQTGNLDLIVVTYNNILRTLLDVERPMVQERLTAIQDMLQMAVATLNWNSFKIDEYIKEVMAAVKELNHIMDTIKGNVEKTQALLKEWEENPMIQRKEGKTYEISEFGDLQRATQEARNKKISEASVAVAKLLSNSNKIVDVPRSSAAWRTYVEYFNDIVTQGFSDAILASTTYLETQIDPARMAAEETAPLVEVSLDLRNPDVRWSPEIGVGEPGGEPGVRDHLDAWVGGFQAIGTLMKRLDIGEGDYALELEEDYHILDGVSRIQNIALENEAACAAFKDSYDKYAYLWKDDMQRALQDFIEERGEEGEDPPLEAFDEEIARYKSMQAEIQELPTTKVIGWIKVDAKPIKQALATWVTKWVFLFTQYLNNKVTNSMDELYAFRALGDKVLDKDPTAQDAAPAEEGEGEPAEAGEGEPGAAEADGAADGDGAAEGDGDKKPKSGAETKLAILYEVMAFMRDVRKRQEKTDVMFEPLARTVELLKSYGISVREETLKQLEEGSMTWSALKKKTLNVREKVSIMQQTEMKHIRQDSERFGKQVEAFRDFFKEKAPTRVAGDMVDVADVEPAYALLDQFHHGAKGAKLPHGSLTTIAAEARALNEKQELFELHVSDYVDLRRSAEDLENLKMLWDSTSTIVFTLDSWRSTLWGEIDTEDLETKAKEMLDLKLDGKKFGLRNLPRTCRAYDLYKQVEDQVKALQTSLPLVGKLKNEAMLPRHWQQLKDQTGKQFTMDEKFSLGDLLALELHKCVDKVDAIQETAVGESKVQDALNKFGEFWGGELANLQFAVFSEGQPDNYPLNLVVPDDVASTLEEHNMALQSLSGNKFVMANPEMAETVGEWQMKLGTVESCLRTWTVVAKKWNMLESVFVGSQDIRQQLPDDSRRFDEINKEFIGLMSDAPDVKNAVEACNMDGRLEQLEEMKKMLAQCEKALQDYLETKRIAFPRFYFVANAALLDILSKGQNPQLIKKYLSTCFDNVHSLKFTEDDKGEPTKTAVTMISGEGEEVPLVDGGCICDGSVEVWLGDLVDAMRKAVWAEFTAALPRYDEAESREDWIMEQGAQNTITVSRTIFTQEINEAFDQIEEGNDNAIRECLDKQKKQLEGLIMVVNRDLKKLDRKKVLTLCTIDVHARDVCQKLIDERVDLAGAFQWQSQLRYGVHEKTRKSVIYVCDAEIDYMYEYIGSPGCLVITPLTDRCYITLTQAQRLVLGGAPAGPAGTGKTETVKDLGRALGIQVYVFNCSDQMDYKAMGQTYKGLAQTGAWGCFDEFNRIPVAVLSVCSTQYKTVLDAIRAKKQKFMFESVEISLRPSIMAFITMNPGYPGRAELPESLKALFRPVSMCVPDLQMICENMLMGEGFLESKILSKKFVILYKLCQDLLSAAPHYDWKLRAIKTTLYVAGGLKRSQPNLTETMVLFQALRDFNLGKLTFDDDGIFRGLLTDLFPGVSVDRQVDFPFEKQIHESGLELMYQVDDSDNLPGAQAAKTFKLKITQLREIFQVRWSVFLLGPAGCGKTAVWKTLMKAQNAFGEKTRMCPINPKAVTRNELYGFLHPTTREWKEGLMSVNFRNFSSQEDVVGEKYKHQWIVLDGDIDAEWIESMNTVMDDNKMLTLASNERLPLTDSMRLLLEINHMLHCSPATVSRGGVIYLNQDDIGWRPMVLSWIEAFHIKDEHFRIAIVNLFDKYLDKALDHCRRNFRTIVPLVPMNIAGSVTKILEGLLPDEPAPGAPPLKPFDEKILEMHFVFAAVWALGGAMFVDSIYDYRKEFHKWWVGTFKDVSFPIDSDDNKARVFDYYVDAEEGRMRPWNEGGKVEDFTYNSSEAFGNIFVPSVESTRLGFLLKSFALRKHYCMFVGNAGTGKTALMKDQLKRLDPDSWTFSTVNMNNSMDAPALQVIMEQPLEKKTGRSYGPPRNRNLVYFFDDMNMPYVDKYDTQSPIEIARQFIDYDGWYDKNEIELKQIQNSQYMACMNPTSGSFTITPRMQRHFVTLAVQMPSTEVLTSIFAKIIEGHLEDFTPEVAKLRTKVAEATIELHAKVTEKFLPSAVKFTHQWNLRELSNITQGLCRSVPEYCQSALTLCRLWVHECERVFSDRMIETKDSNEFNDIRQTLTKKFFPDVDMVALEEKPISFTEFIEAHPNGEDDAFAYAECGSYEKLNKVLVGHLEEYNTSGKATMDLVLFNQAMEHVTRIARVLSLPRGNAMLVGVGGSGKQSLAKLATFICSTATNPMELVQIAVTSSYGMVEFREDLFNMYEKAGKGMRMTFLMTDGQIVNEKFLVYLNDLLSSGFIPDLLTDEQQEQMQNNVRKQCKEAGIQDSNENLFEFFLDMVRKNLHVCLCFSPVGDKFRIRARNFPALVNCTVINAFQPWPHEALVSVAGRFLSEIPELPGNVLESLQFHCAATHQAVTEASEAYRIQDRRYNYTTPKSYLELISLYKTMLAQKREELKAAKERLENGVGKIASAQAQVKDLLIKVNEDKIEVEQKKAETDQLIVSIGKEKAIVDKKVEESAGEEAEAAAKAAECEEINAKATAALAEAQPALDAAAAALNGLDKKALGEYKNNSNPPPPTEQALEAAIILTCRGKFPKDISRPAMQKAVGDVGKFFNMLNNFDAKSPKECPEKVIEKIEKDYLKCKATPEEFVRQETGFDAQNIGGKNPAAGGLTDWVVNICKFYRINQVVEPIQIAQRNAQAELDAVNEKLAGVRKIVADLQAKVDGLENNLMVATEAKNAAIAAAEKTQAKADLADRLINGLAGENKRWNDDIARMGREYEKLIGDVMMASSFVSYAGAFNSKFREILVNEKWMPSIVQKEIPVRPTESPMESVLATLASPTTMAQWGIEGLPTDPLSIQNGAIMSNAARWSLMIDPQLQGIAWIKKKYELMPAESLKGEIRIIQLSKPKYINDVEECIKTGTPLIIENLPDDIDAVLDPVVARQTSTKPNGSVVITLGGNELDYDPDFRLYLQTKLSNPHYKPEIAAQTTLVNFCVTEKGLEDQLLALVVEKEREDLQLQSSALVRQLGEFTVQMTGLEDNLLERLKNSQGDILEDIALIENLEETKKTVAEIEDQTEKAKVLQVEIDEKREKYRPVAERGALMYFLIDALSVLDRVYQYSMGNFVYILKKGMQLTPGNESGEPLDGKPLEERVQALIETVSETVYGYVASGLFERHKLIVASQLTFAKLKKEDKLQHAKFQWLLKGSRVSGVENPLAEWIAEPNWQCVQSLKEIEGYDALPGDLEGSAKRWREWMELERPEEEPMPGDWKKYPPFEKLLLFRALRPDRMSNALSTFVRGEMGPFFVTSAAFDLAKSFEDSAPGTPMFIFLSPGVDVAAAVETLGAQLGFSSDNGNYASVSLGQGQESIAMDNLRAAHEKGGWVLLQNIHLTIDWTNGPLEKMVDKLAEGAHEDFRLFLSAEPPPILERGLAISLLQNSIKLTNEPPEGMKQNLARAYGNFTEEMFEACAKQAEFKQIVFALCYFHAAILERKKFGVGNMPDAASGIGWNMNYPFNTGDLLCCGQCVNNYLENNSNVPWDDIKYIIGEIMYGGHVVEDWDRRTVEMYLNHYFKEELLEGLDFFPKFPAPPSNLNHKQTMEYIAETFPTESPLAFGLHPNAEIGFKLREAESLCASVLSLQPRDGGGEGGASTEHVAREALVKLTEILEGKEFDMEDIRKRAPDPVTPYVMVAIQEAERMNVLLAEISRSLTELSLGLEGKLTMSNPMEELMYALAEERIYAGWVKLAYPSLRGLTSWTENLCRRIEQLQIWTGDLELPKVVWISGLFNPQSFLTAVMQTTARRNEWALDKTAITTEVTKKTAEQVEAPSRDGAFVHGLTLEGCRWNDVVGVLEESAPKEMFCEMPVMTIKAVVAEKAEARDAYQCPVYKTERRFREEVFTAQLKSKHGQIKWTLCGVCLFLDVV